MKSSEDPRQELLSRRLSQLAQQVGSEGFHSGDDLERMQRLAASHRPALSRTCYEPGHFTASGFVLSPDKQSLLLIFHKKLNLWLQPGGHIEDEDSDLVFAARREVEEETGLRELSVEESFFDLDVHRIPAWGETPAHLHFDIRSLFLARGGEVRASDEVSDARWFSLRQITMSAEVLADGFGTDGSVRRVAARLFEMHCK